MCYPEAYFTSGIVYVLGKVNPDREFGFSKVHRSVHFFYLKYFKRCVNILLDVYCLSNIFCFKYINILLNYDPVCFTLRL